jgi:hypothetical protein
VRLFPSGYAGAILSLAAMRLRADVRALDPEMRRRIFRLMKHLARLGIPYGIGGGGRSAAEQLRGFLERHYEDDDGPIEYDGRRWSRYAWAAPMAPPGLSFHEETPPYKACAVDTVPATSWDEANYIAALFGLQHFDDDEMEEPWHVHLIEFPRSRRTYNADPVRYKVQRYRPPGSKKPGPKFPPYPPLRKKVDR